MSEHVTPVESAAPAVESAPALAPTAEVTILTPATAPVEVPAAEVVVETPVVAPEPVVETQKPAEASLLEAAKTTEEPKKPDAEGTKPLEPVEARTYEPFTLPEGVPVDEARINAFREIVGPANLDQATAQKLVDLHTETLQALQAKTLQDQIAAFAETRRGWREKSLADEQIGGAGHQTAMMAAARMRDLAVPEGMRQEFAEFLAATGVGDHPVFIKIFHNFAKMFDEPAAPPIPARPVPDRGGSGKQSKNAVLYDHPSSRRAAGR